MGHGYYDSAGIHHNTYRSRLREPLQRVHGNWKGAVVVSTAGDVVNVNVQIGATQPPQHRELSMAWLNDLGLYPMVGSGLALHITGDGESEVITRALDAGGGLVPGESDLPATLNGIREIGLTRFVDGRD